MIEVDHLEKHFGKHHEIKAVAGATFRAKDGEEGPEGGVSPLGRT